MIAHDPILASWAAFYTVTGSSAAALTGLTFVVITLVGSVVDENQPSPDGLSVFTTPTVVHFGSALLVSALFCAPWTNLAGPAAILVVVGLVGLGYVGRAALLSRAMKSYTPDVEDWVWYTIVPFVAYAAMTIAGIALSHLGDSMLFLAAASVTLLLLIGIRNSWDVVTYLAISGRADNNDEAKT